MGFSRGLLQRFRLQPVRHGACSTWGRRLAATGTVAYSVAARSLVSALIPRERLNAANGRLELARSAAFTAGPALAGGLIGWAGAGVAFGFAAALSVCASPGRDAGRHARPGLGRRRDGDVRRAA